MRQQRKTYTELSQLSTLEDRFNYLNLHGTVGMDTFGVDRYMNQKFYTSAEWKRVRNLVIARDNGCDLGLPGHEIQGEIVVHHMVPIDPEAIQHSEDILLDPEYLITCSAGTHRAIHYGTMTECKAQYTMVDRSMNDMCPWKR